MCILHKPSTNRKILILSLHTEMVQLFGCVIIKCKTGCKTVQKCVSAFLIEKEHTFIHRLGEVVHECNQSPQTSCYKR